jgi:hypothetical protein
MGGGGANPGNAGPGPGGQPGTGGHHGPRLALLGGATLKLDRHGRVELTVRSDRAARATLRLRHGRLTLGHTSLRLKAGKRKAVTIALSRHARSLVRHAHRHRLSATELLSARDATGGASAASRTLTLRR